MPTSPQAPARLRLWPALVIAASAAIALVWIWAPSDALFRQTQTTATMTTAIVTLLLLMVWWTLLSRARWRNRLLGLVGLVALGWAASYFVELRGVSGDLVPQFAWRSAEQPAPLPPQTLAAPPPTVAAASAVESETEADAPEGEPAPAPADAPSAADAVEAEPAPPGRLARDFPQFLGPARNATLRGIGLARSWDRERPVALWRQPIGSGWSSFAVADGLAVTQEQRDGRELVVAYDLESGEVRWAHTGAQGYESPISGDGPRATPTIHDGRVYAFGAKGVLRALEIATGRLLFERNVLEETGGRSPDHGMASSPLVVDGVVVVLAGGPDGSSLVAYDQATGERRWSGGDDPAAYSSPLVATLGGVRQIVAFNLHHLTGHDIETGAVLWQDRWPKRPEKVSQPVILEGDRIFVSMGYGVGGRLVRILRDDDGGFRAELVWETLRLKAKFTQVVTKDGFFYGLDDGILVCLDPADGERRWKRGRYGHGQILLVDDLLLVQSEHGELVLIDPNPEGLVELARFQAVEGKAWATPALAGDLLIVRSDAEVACYRMPTQAG